MHGRVSCALALAGIIVAVSMSSVAFAGGGEQDKVMGSIDKRVWGQMPDGRTAAPCTRSRAPVE